MLTPEAFNALLKTLEEPPAHVLFIFATTEPRKIPITILSRCQRHDFKRISLEDILEHLRGICEETSLDISDESLRLLAREADGSMRDALSLLDQIMAYSDGTATDDQVLDILGAVDRKVIFDLSSALLAHDAGKALGLLDIVYNHGHDLKRLAMQMVEHFRNLLIVRLGHATGPLVDVPTHELALMEQQIVDVSQETLNQFFTTLFQAEAGVRLSPQPKIALEMLFIRLCQLNPVVSFDHIIKRLDHLAQVTGTGQGAALSEAVRPVSEPEISPVLEERAAPEQKPTSSDSPSQTWGKLLAAIGKECPTLIPTLEQASLTEMRENSLDITVTGNSFYTARLRDKKSMASLQKVCDRLFQRRMKIKILESGKSRPKKSKNNESDKTRRLKKEALDHPLVADAVEVFKGRVVDVKIL
jgi:DNA polymerase-3 subunit gamma/tau